MEDDITVGAEADVEADLADRRDEGAQSDSISGLGVIGVELIPRVPGDAGVDERSQLEPHGHRKAIDDDFAHIPQEILVLERGDELVLPRELLAEIIDLCSRECCSLPP